MMMSMLIDDLDHVRLSGLFDCPRRLEASDLAQLSEDDRAEIEEWTASAYLYCTDVVEWRLEDPPAALLRVVERVKGH